jgi:hypothetical protein
MQEDEESMDLGPSAVSFGPAHRRRLSSMHRNTGLEPSGTQVQSTGLRKFPTMGTTSSLDVMPLSESPDHRPPSEVQLAVTDTDKNDFGVSKEWIARLETMEQTQKRIEDMLIQLTKELKDR